MNILPVEALAQLRRVAIYRLGSLGDTIVALPCFHHIAKLTPQAERIVLTNVPVNGKAAPLEAVLHGSGLVHGTLSYPVGTRSLETFRVLRRQLQALDTDTLVYLTPARGLTAAWRDLAYFRWCGFRRILGIPLTPDMQNNRVLDAQGTLEYEGARLARCLRRLGTIDLHERASWDLHLSAQEHAAAQAVCHPLRRRAFVAINMGGKVAANDWGMDNWLSLLASLHGLLRGWGLLVVGGPEDSERARQAATLWEGGPMVNACGRLRPRESAAALADAALFIGHDSGPMHLAAAMQVPCIGLFGDNNPPGKWHPIGAMHRPLHRMAGVRTIAPSEVLEHSRQALGSRLHASLSRAESRPGGGGTGSVFTLGPPAAESSPP